MPFCAKFPYNINELPETSMFHARDCKTGSLFDKWAYMGPKRRNLPDDSWAGLFRKEILPELPVGELAPAFHEVNGRPTKEMYTTLGALIFQQMLDLNDEETVEQLAFNVLGHLPLARAGGDRIFVRVITRFLVNLKRHHRDLFESLDGSFSERYLTRKGQGVFSMVKPSETDRTLQRLATDLFDLVRRFAG